MNKAFNGFNESFYGGKINWDFYQLPTDIESRPEAGQIAARLELRQSIQRLRDSLTGYYDTCEMTSNQVYNCRQRCHELILALEVK